MIESEVDVQLISFDVWAFIRFTKSDNRNRNFIHFLVIVDIANTKSINSCVSILDGIRSNYLKIHVQDDECHHADVRRVQEGR